MKKVRLFHRFWKKDILLSFPFVSIKPFINLLYEAAEDDSVVSIKMTLYRLANKSQIVDALVKQRKTGRKLLFWWSFVPVLMKKVILNIQEN